MWRWPVIISFCAPTTRLSVEVMVMAPGKKVHDYLIGRICYVGIET